MEFPTQHCFKKIGNDREKSHIHRERNETWITSSAKDKIVFSSRQVHPTVSAAKHWMEHPSR